jgi:hypothetical protein
MVQKQTWSIKNYRYVGDISAAMTASGGEHEAGELGRGRYSDRDDV